MLFCIWHRIVDPAKQLNDKIGCRHGVLLFLFGCPTIRLGHLMTFVN
jgi:Na+-transporting NADH:ubiquinone oxidoreductase subunit F